MSVSSYFQTPRSWLKKNSAAPRFSNLLLGVWKSEETLFVVFDLLLQLYIENIKKFKAPSTLIQIQVFENSISVPKMDKMFSDHDETRPHPQKR